jgi:hypothetical protein
MNTWNIEITDTYGGEANYCWVKRDSIEVKEYASYLSIIRKAKKMMGWNNIRCKVEMIGETLQLIPEGMCQVMFVTPSY